MKEQTERMIHYAEAALKDAYAEQEIVEEKRTRQILDVFRKHQVSYRHFSPTTGYGYDDVGRDTLEKIYADVFHTEAALMRPHIASGTSALSLTLFGLTRPGDRILSVTGLPYDTLWGIIGIGKETPPGSLKEMGVGFDCVDLKKDGTIDLEAVEAAMTPRTTLVIAQRSRGYAWRPSLMPEAFEPLSDLLHRRYPGVLFMVDNCYGAFVREKEPTDFGADVCVGSLIKNPGGGIAPTGGYIAGSRESVERVAWRLTAPWYEDISILCRTQSGYHTGDSDGNAGASCCFLSGDTVGQSHRFHGFAGTLGHARIRRQGRYGCRNLCCGGKH